MPANKKKAANMRGHVADFIKARHNEKRAREAELNRLDNEVGKDEVEKRHEANNSCCPAEADLVEKATKDDGIDDSSERAASRGYPEEKWHKSNTRHVPEP